MQNLSPEMATADVRPAMLIIPGGGFSFCSDREAEPIALAYMAEGYNAFVLRYTAGPDVPWERCFEDAVAALTYVCDHAETLRIDPKKVAVIGFSAGGHLAAALGTMAETRPDALVLGYPVILEEMGQPLLRQIPSTDKAVDTQTPPSFLFATSSDNIVPIQNSLTFAKALADHNIFFEMHIYPIGDHGFTLGKPAFANNDSGLVNADAQDWFADSIRFLRHVIGDFMVDGKEWISDLPDYNKPRLDVPINYLFRYQQNIDILEQILPGVPETIRSTPAVHGFTICQFSAWAQELFPQEKLQELGQSLFLWEADKGLLWGHI